MFKENRESIALFGGSFDPPHFGHKSVLEEFLNVTKVDKVMVIPTFLNPFKTSSYFPASKRLEMTKNMFDSFLNVFISDFEIEEGKATPTAITLAHFQKQYNVKYIIIGADNLLSIDKWYNFKIINEQVEWVIATRVGYDIDTSMLRAFKILDIDADISSTAIRNKMTKDNAQMSINEMSIQDRAERIVTFLDDKKADELEVFNLDEVDYIAKRVVIANAISSKHAAALADMLKKELKPLGEVFLHIDESEDWVVVDLGDILIHLMTSEARQTYNMEEFLAELSAGKYKSSYSL